jgi:hypothetical protein
MVSACAIFRARQVTRSGSAGRAPGGAVLKGRFPCPTRYESPTTTLPNSGNPAQQSAKQLRRYNAARHADTLPECFFQRRFSEPVPDREQLEGAGEVKTALHLDQFPPDASSPTQTIR